MAAVVKGETDLTTGPIFKKLVKFAIPLIIADMLQRLFNAADTAVLGIFVADRAVADRAVAAVGANTALINLIINLFIGFSVGANVVLSRCVGKGDSEKAHRVVGTAVLMSLIIGTALIFVGVFGARTFLTWMNCDPEVLDLATLYLQIYFLGMPIIMLYNFSASLLRAVGDTFRPMIYLFIAGVVNLGLNILFVTAFNMTVEGVAIATVVSQLVSGGLSVITLIKNKGYGSLERKHFRIYKNELGEIIKVGLPSGLQSSMFSISNVMIQSTVNSYGEFGMSGNSIASQFDAFVWSMGNSIAVAGLSFVSQNYGAMKLKRIKKGVLYASALAFGSALCLGMIVLLLSDVLCGIMTDTPAVVAFAKERLVIMCSTYCICGIMDVLSYTLRALGKSTTVMIVSLIFACAFRIVWLNSVYLIEPSFYMIFWSYPVSWVLNIGVNLIVFAKTFKAIRRKAEEKEKSLAAA